MIGRSVVYKAHYWIWVCS